MPEAEEKPKQRDFLQVIDQIRQQVNFTFSLTADQVGINCAIRWRNIFQIIKPEDKSNA